MRDQFRSSISPFNQQQGGLLLPNNRNSLKLDRLAINKEQSQKRTIQLRNRLSLENKCIKRDKYHSFSEEKQNQNKFRMRLQFNQQNKQKKAQLRTITIQELPIRSQTQRYYCNLISQRQPCIDGLRVKFSNPQDQLIKLKGKIKSLRIQNDEYLKHQEQSVKQKIKQKVLPQYQIKEKDQCPIEFTQKLQQTQRKNQVKSCEKYQSYHLQDQIRQKIKVKIKETPYKCPLRRSNIWKQKYLTEFSQWKRDQSLEVEQLKYEKINKKKVFFPSIGLKHSRVWIISKIFEERQNFKNQVIKLRRRQMSSEKRQLKFLND